MLTQFKQFTGIQACHSINGFRLTADAAGLPIPSGDVVGGTTLRGAFFTGGQVGLLDSAGSPTVYTHPTKTIGPLTLSGLTINKNYTVFLALDPGLVYGIRGLGQLSTGTTASAVITLPTNVAGDTLVITYFSDSALPVSPAGWTVVNQNRDGTSAVQMSTYTKISVGAEASVTIASNTQTAWRATAYALQNMVLESTSMNLGSSISPGLTALDAGRVLLSVHALVSPSNGILTPTVVQANLSVIGKLAYLAGIETVLTGFTGGRIPTASGTFSSAMGLSVLFKPTTPPFLTLELSAPWTSDTVPADTMSYVNGISVKTSNITRREFGMIRATSATTTEDSQNRPWVWSRDNQVMRACLATGVLTTAATLAVGAIATFSTLLNLDILVGAVQNIEIIQKGIFNNSSNVAMDAAISVQLNAVDYRIASFVNDTVSYESVAGRKNVICGVGLQTFVYRWQATGGTGALQYPGSGRGGLSNLDAISIAAKYLR